MITYILLFLFILFIWLVSESKIKGINKSAIQNICFVLCLIPFTFLPGFRYNIGGTDYFIYKESYEIISDVVYFIKFEPGYNLLMLLFNKLGFSFDLFLFAITAMSSALLFISIKKNTQNIFLAVLIYLAKLYIFYNFVLVRQMIAIPFVWLSIDSLINNKKKKFLLFVIIASLFHLSAVIFLLLIFIYKTKWNIKKLTIIFTFAFSIFIFNSFILRSVIHIIPYVGDRLAAYVNVSDGSIINPLNFLESFILLFIATFYKKELSSRIENFNVFYNLLIIFIFILIAFFNITVFKRIRDYFIISYFSILSGTILISKKGLSQILVLTLIVIYLLLLYIRSIYVFDTTTGGVGNLVPYQSIFR